MNTTISKVFSAVQDIIKYETMFWPYGWKYVLAVKIIEWLQAEFPIDASEAGRN